VILLIYLNTKNGLFIIIKIEVNIINIFSSYLVYCIKIMADLHDEIAELKADIRSIKAVNPNWASDAGLIAAISACRTQLAGLEARLVPCKPHPSVLFLLISPPL